MFVLRNKQFSSKCFYEHVEYSFDNLGETFWMKGRKNISQCPKMIQFFQKNFLEIILWTRRMRFWHLSRKLLNRRPQLYCWMSKTIRKFLSRIYSIKMFRLTRRILFWLHRRNFSTKKPKRFCSLSWKDANKNFSGKIHCLRLFLRARRMQFRSARRNFLHIRP